MPDVELSITATGIDEWRQYLESIDIAEHVSPKFEDAIRETVEYAQSIAPHKTGAYAQSIFYEKRGPLSFIFGSRSPHAAPIEYGSMPHFILPRTARALRFEADGEIVFAKYVMHPGTAPQYIIHRAKKDNLPKIFEAIREGVREALGKK